MMNANTPTTYEAAYDPATAGELVAADGRVAAAVHAFNVQFDF